uniref:Secreted protein n=1 Tax=Macrostomum lignano TaxID=282301 RepID=A0A1I8IK57_9PLAT
MMHLSVTWICKFLFVSTLSVALAIEDGSGCTTPGSPCPVPRGGVCTTKESKLACDCPASQTIVQHASGKVCQTKDGSGCTTPGSPCPVPRGGVCTTKESKLACDCPASQTIVQHASGKVCQTSE